MAQAAAQEQQEFIFNNEQPWLDAAPTLADLRALIAALPHQKWDGRSSLLANHCCFPLHAAAAANQVAVVQYLLQEGAVVDCKVRQPQQSEGGRPCTWHVPRAQTH